MGRARTIGAEQCVHHYQVIGRKEPTASDPAPQLFRMQIFAVNEVSGKCALGR